jgi:elongation factor G
VGHHAAGKTTLVEALLATTGAITRQGSVERGSTVCDFEPEEISRQLSVSLAIAPITVEGVKINLLDAPGYADFAAEAAAALATADLAVLVVSATDGVQAQTEDAWRAAAARDLPRVIVINKLDRERADFERVLADVRDRFGAGVAPVELPIGREQDFRGVIDLFDDTATLYQPGSAGPGVGTVGPIPEDLVDHEHVVHEQLVEGIVVGDDDLMARYLDGETISRDELELAMAGGVASGSVFPVLCCSGLTGVGIDRLARLLVELAPTPAARPPVEVLAGDTTREVACDPMGPPLLQVCKILAAQHTGRVALAKVLSGTVRPDDVLTNPRTRSDERLHVLQTLRGREVVPATEAVAGDFVALPRLAALAGDTLAPKGMPVTIPFPEPEPPPLRIAVRPASRADDDKLMSALQRLCEEDPSLQVTRVDETHQTVLGVSGEIHYAVTVERLARRSHVAVEREEVAVPYRETITTTADCQETYKKQTGGHGQYAVVHLSVDPMPRGSGFEFHDKVVGGAIPRQFIPAVEKGVRESMASGGPGGGYPIVDVSVTCVDGKHHPVDSSEMSFKTAASLAFQAAVRKASPVVLEPISRLEVTVPAESQGDVLGDLHARRGRVQGTEVAADGQQTVIALVPTAELARYAVDLRAITGGRGRIRTAHDHYDIAP